MNWVLKNCIISILFILIITPLDLYASQADSAYYRIKEVRKLKSKRPDLALATAKKLFLRTNANNDFTVGRIAFYEFLSLLRFNAEIDSFFWYVDHFIDNYFFDEKSKVDTLTGYLLYEQSLALNAKDQFSEGLKLAQKAYRVADSLGDKELLYYALRSEGIIYRDRGLSSEALASLTNAQLLAEEIKDERLQIRNLLSISNIHRNEYRDSLSLALTLQAKALFEQSKIEDMILEMD